MQRKARKIDDVNASTAMDDPTAMAREDVCSKVLRASEMKQENMVSCNTVCHSLRAFKGL